MKQKVATMKEGLMRDFNNILEKVSCEHSPAFNAQMIKYSRNIHILKGEKKHSLVFLSSIIFQCTVLYSKNI